MHIQILKTVVVSALAIFVFGCGQNRNEAPPENRLPQVEQPVSGDASKPSNKLEPETLAPAAAQSVPVVAVQSDSALPAPETVPEEPVPSNLPTDLKEFKVELPDALKKISKQKDQICLVNSEYSESLFGLSTLIEVYCNMEKVTWKYVHELGFRRTAELHMLSMYVIKKSFRDQGFSVLECNGLPNTSESGLSINGQSACSFSRKKK